MHDFTVIVADPDEINIDISETMLNVTEESTATYGIRLSHQPRTNNTSTVLIDMTAPDPSTRITLDNPSFTFDSTNWDQYQTVTITGAADANLTNETFTLTHSILGPDAGTARPTLTVVRIDNDTPNLDVSPSSITITEASSGTFELELTQQPAQDVTVTVAPVTNHHDLTVSTSDCASAGSTATFTFTTTSWSTSQDARVCAANDYDAQNDLEQLSLHRPKFRLEL